MRKFIALLLIGFMISCTSSSGETRTTHTTPIVDKTALWLKANQGLVFYKDEPFTGVSVEGYPNRQTAESITYQAGKRHGLREKWFNDGTLSYSSNYQNGKLEGEAKSWWRNGNLRSLYIYQNGIANGLQQEWYISGAKFKFRHLADGKEAGMQQSWRENGKIYNNYEAKNGRIFGLKRANLCFQLEDEAVVYSD